MVNEDPLQLKRGAIYCEVCQRHWPVPPSMREMMDGAVLSICPACCRDGWDYDETGTPVRSDDCDGSPSRV